MTTTASAPETITLFVDESRKQPKLRRAAMAMLHDIATPELEES